MLNRAIGLFGICLVLLLPVVRLDKGWRRPIGAV